MPEIKLPQLPDNGIDIKIMKKLEKSPPLSMLYLRLCELVQKKHTKVTTRELTEIMAEDRAVIYLMMDKFRILGMVRTHKIGSQQYWILIPKEGEFIDTNLVKIATKHLEKVS